MGDATAVRGFALDPGSRCPGCAKAIDPLRAGHVAIYDGVFLYYCDATCKALHLRTVASHLGDDVPTLDPPAVAARAQGLLGAAPAATNGEVPSGPRPHDALASFVPSTPPVSTSPTSHERDRDDEEDHDDESDDDETRDGALVAEGEAVEYDQAPDEPPASLDSIPLFPAPQTMRSPAVARPEPVAEVEIARASVPARASSPPKRAPGALSTRAAISVAGGVAGVLVPLLAIADVQLPVRLGLALFATLMLVVRTAMVKRDAAEMDAGLAALPVVLAAGVAATCVVSGDPRGAPVAVLAGLSASVALAVEEAIERAWREVNAARARVAGILGGTSRVVRGEAIVDSRDVKAGEEVVIETGDIVGVDGIVRAGEVTVVPWDGAPVEVTKADGDAVVAGARVVSGRARLVTSWSGADRAWARATSSPASRPDVSAQTARLARGLAVQAVPIAAVVAAGAAYAGGMASGWIGALSTACAAGVAMAGRSLVSAVALIHARAQVKTLAHGVVYRDARSFDAAGRAAIAVVCSRGTVLTGIPEIVAVESLAPGGDSPREGSDSRILALAAGAETASTHPFANAILRAVRIRGVRIENVRSATVHAGLGVTALASSGERLVVGSRALLLQEKVSVAVVEARASELEAQGRSVLLVALAGKLVGLIALQDGLRAGARAAIQRLLDARIEPVLLSGESRETCETIARALDIDHVRPEVLPAERGAEVRALAEGGQVVSVVGHPASDDSALGAADVAIAMGAAGRVAGEWGVSLASDDVRDGALALSVAHAARDRARAVLAIALAPGVVTLLALIFAVGPLVCGPLAMGVAAAVAIALARRD